MTEQQQNDIPNEAKFLRALGVNPENVLGGSVKIEWQNGTPFIYFTSIHPVSPHAVGLAFLAAAPAPEDSGDNVTQMKQPEDHKKPAKKAAAKRPAKKAVAKGEAGGSE